MIGFGNSSFDRQRLPGPETRGGGGNEEPAGDEALKCLGK